MTRNQIRQKTKQWTCSDGKSKMWLHVCWSSNRYLLPKRWFSADVINIDRFITVLGLWRSLAVVCVENVGRRRPGANDSAMEFMEKQTIDERSDVDILEQYPAPTWKSSRRKIRDLLKSDQAKTDVSLSVFHLSIAVLSFATSKVHFCSYLFTTLSCLLRGDWGAPRLNHPPLLSCIRFIEAGGGNMYKKWLIGSYFLLSFRLLSSQHKSIF